MVKMISKTALVYGTRRLQAGDVFDARGESDARLLIALRRAERAPKIVEKPAPAPRARRQRAVEPAAPAVVAEAVEAVRAETPFERTVPLPASDVVVEAATAPAPRRRLSLRNLSDFTRNE